MEEFALEGNEFIELHNLLKVMGWCGTGGMAKTAIADGRVTVDGSLELRKRRKIRSGQIVSFEGHAVRVS